MEESKKEIDKKNEINLIDIFLVFWKRRIFIIKFSSIVVVLGIIYSLIQQPYYSSYVTLYKNISSQNAPSGILSLASSFGYGGSQASNNFSIEDLLNSRNILSKIVTRKWDTELSDDSLNLIEYWGIETDDYLEAKIKASKALSERFSYEMDELSFLVTVNLLMEEPKLARDVLTYATKLIDKYVQSEQKTTTKNNIKYINKRLDSVRNELTNAEIALKNFRQNNMVISQSPELQLKYARLQREVSIKQQVYMTLEKEKESAKIELVKETPVIDILDEPVAPYKRAKPKRTLIVIISGFLGLFLSLGVIVIQKFYSMLYKETKQRGESLKLFNVKGIFKKSKKNK